jgi:hypothetical protein
MEEGLWYRSGSPELSAAIRRVWNFAARTCPLNFPPGVYKHRSVDDATRLREQWEDANWRRLHDLRRQKE